MSKKTDYTLDNQLIKRKVEINFSCGKSFKSSLETHNK